LVRETALSASAKPDLAFNFVRVVEQTTWEKLKVPEGFDAVDAKLHAAITEALPPSWIGRRMVKTEESARLGVRVRGRQLLRLVLDQL